MSNELTNNNLNDVDQQTVERLRASKDAFERKIKTSGERAGIDYVGQKANYEELQRLDRWYDSIDCIGTATDGWRFVDVASVMSGDDGSERDIENDLRLQHGDDIDDQNWFAAFIEGAVTKFNELKASI